MALLSHGLLPASFRGAPFAVEQDDTGGGRRIALHQYPGRDEPWAEDMGRAARVFRFRGFIVDGDVVFAGGPIILQRLLLLAALEKAGSGTLTHPTLGVLNVSVRSFSLGADLGAGRMSRVDIEFVESGKKTFPSLLSSSSGLLSAANLAKLALAVDLVRGISLAISLGGRRADAATVAGAKSDAVVAAASDATSTMKLTAMLPGSFGRYTAGGNVGYLGGNPSSYAAGTTIAALAAIASAQRTAVVDAAAAIATTMAQVGAGTTDTDTANAIARAVDALVASCADPADAIRLLIGLIGTTGNGRAASTAIGQAIAVAFARAAVAALAATCSLYQPSSYDDAFALLARVAQLVDDQATSAADAGDDASFKALRALKSQVAQDLRARGASLSPMRTFSVGAPVPSLALAQRLYRDPSRAGQLAQQVDAPNPLFMPTQFQALAA